MYIICLLHVSSCSKNPIILIPGSFRSKIYVNSTREQPWYCSKSKQNHLAWISPTNFIPPNLNCYLDYFKLEYDTVSKKVTNATNTSVFNKDFGGVSDVYGTGFEFYGTPVFTYFGKIIERFNDEGYVVKESIFGAPYDWRLGIAHLGSYFDNLKDLVEEAYEKNNQTKVSLFCHSLGCFISHTFLSEKTEASWREKYIKCIVMCAPSFSGAGTALQTIIRGSFPFIPFIKTNTIKEFVYSLGTCHIHIPNSKYYEDDVLYFSENGTYYTGRNISIAVKEILGKKYYKIAKPNLEYTKERLSQMDVPTYIFYNSAIKTTAGADMRRIPIYGESIKYAGDGLVLSKGIDWACNNWNQSLVKCHDFNSTRLKHYHQVLPHTQEIMDNLLSIVINGTLI